MFEDHHSGDRIIDYDAELHTLVQSGLASVENPFLDHR